MLIRVFTVTDSQQVIDLTTTSLRESYPESFFMTISQYWPEGFLIAEVDGRLEGFVMGVISGVRQARILMLAVREPLRSKGIGSALVRAFTSSALAKGMDSVILEVRASNVRAMKLYERLGFKEIGKLRSYYRDGEDGVRMQMIMQS